jgi:hypothetical protein
LFCGSAVEHFSEVHEPFIRKALEEPFKRRPWGALKKKALGSLEKGGTGRPLKQRHCGAFKRRHWATFKTEALGGF